MPFLSMRHDFRAPAFAPASSQEIYATALEQFAWADEHGFDSLVLSEHHGVDDGWMPAPLTMAGVRARPHEAGAADDQRRDPAAARPDPDRGADRGARQRRSRADCGSCSARATASRSSRWRASSTRRAARSSRSTSTTVLEALDGRAVRVARPRRSWSRPSPSPIRSRCCFVGGGVPAAARRAARLRLSMFPMNTDAVVRDAYFDEAKKIGFEGGFVLQPVGPTFVHVADDPEKAWAEIGKYVLYEAQTYASFQTPGQHSTPGVHAESVDDLKASPQYVVGTPDQVRARLEQVPPTAASCSTRSRAACRPTSPGPASSCSRPRSCRICGHPRALRVRPDEVALLRAAFAGVPSAQFPLEEVGNGPLPPFRHHPRRRLDRRRGRDAGGDRGCALAARRLARRDRTRSSTRWPRRPRIASTSGGAA